MPLLALVNSLAHQTHTKAQMLQLTVITICSGQWAAIKLNYHICSKLLFL